MAVVSKGARILAAQKKQPKPKPEIGKRDSFRMALGTTWRQFAQTTTIHGLKYTLDADANFCVRSLWMIAIVACLGCAVEMVSTFYVDFMSNPTRMNVDTNYAPLTDLVFPAVTICPTNHISFVKTRQFMRNVTLPPNMTRFDVMKIIHLVDGFIEEVDYSEDDLATLQEVVDLNHLTIPDFMNRLRVDCDDFMVRCRFRMELVDCKKFFTRSKTYLGDCCSFNIDQAGSNFTRFRATRPGIGGGLSVVVRILPGDRPITSSYSNGFKILIHGNEEYPNDETIEKMTDREMENMFLVRPKEIACSDQVRQLPIDDRQCVFPEEQTLEYFPRYLYLNCEYECEIKKIIRTCGCVPYTFLPIQGVEVCNFTQIPCLVDMFGSTVLNKEESTCDCPSNCQELQLDVSQNTARIETGSSINSLYEGIQRNSTVIHIFMNSQVYRRLRRDLLSNLITLISNLGSAFSLFVGMSIISVIEIIYYFTFVLRQNYVAARNQNDAKDQRRVRLFVQRQRVKFINVEAVCGN